MRALTCAGYDYMRKAVSDLQRQLNELNAMARLNRPDISASDGRSGTAVASGGNRVNPFNQDLESTQEVFPTQSADLLDVRPQRARTFEEMHFDIGEQIQSATMKIQNSRFET